MKKIIDKTTENLKRNLMYQVSKLMKNCNEKSIKTRYRYFQAVERFCEFLAERYRLQKWTRVKPKHIVAYAKYMQEQGYSASSQKTDLSGIRFFSEKSDNENVLPSNEMLSPFIDSRQIGHLDRAWYITEIESAISLALSMGHEDIALSFKMAAIFGMRLEETCKCQVDHIKKAHEHMELQIVGKGGQQRYVHLKTVEQRTLAVELLAYAKSKKRSGCDRLLYDNVKGSTEREKKKIQNWIENHREKFEDNSRNTLDENMELEMAARECGVKLKVTCITMHGLRHYFCQRRMDYYKGKGCTPETARRNVSEEMGHHRGGVTYIYLCETRGRKKPDKAE